MSPAREPVRQPPQGEFVPSILPRLGRRARVLFAAEAAGEPTQALVAAQAIARALWAELHVLRVIPDERWSLPLFPQRHAAVLARWLKRPVEEDQETHAWCQRTLLATPDSVKGRAGAFETVVAEEAGCIGADLVVVPPADVEPDDRAARLALAMGRPVLVARRPARGNAVVAGTSLEDPGYPVLEQAIRLSRGLDASAVFVHNVGPISLAKAAGDPRSDAAGPRLLFGRRLERLHGVAKQLDASAEVVIAAAPSTPEALLHIARDREADLIVIGVHRRWRLLHWITGQVARRVVGQARRSVLVVPIDPPPPPGAPPRPAAA